jgi:hypothetical protein
MASILLRRGLAYLTWAGIHYRAHRVQRKERERTEDWWGVRAAFGGSKSGNKFFGGGFDKVKPSLHIERELYERTGESPA